MSTKSKTATVSSPDQSLGAPQTLAHKITYITDTKPEPGSAVELRPGVFWLRFLLPMDALNHINLYAIDDGDGWVLIDTGIGDKASKDIWRAHFDGFMDGRPVKRVICTHMHPDHIGLAGWLTRKFSAPLFITRGEYLMCRVLVADTGQPAPEAGVRFYRETGFTEEQIKRYQDKFGRFGMGVAPLPNSYERLQDGDVLTIGGHEWRIVTGNGHSPEHACLLCEELEICFSGDQILPRITSNVSVWPTEPNANPMEDWIDSCHKMIREIPEDTLIGPAHGLPFTGVHNRLNALIGHHENALNRLTEHCREPKMATEVYGVLFKREITDGIRIMAVGESIAHLNCLVGRGRVKREKNAAGQWVYTAVN